MFKKIHSQIKTVVLFVTEVFLQIIKFVLEFSSLWLPVIYIWTSIIDKEFNIISALGYMMIGIICFYVSLALDEILKNRISDLNKKNNE